MNDEDIERKAVEELLLEAKRARERAEQVGTFGWNKPKIAAVNKRFLKNTLVSTMRWDSSRREMKPFREKDTSASEQRGFKRRHETDDVKKKTSDKSSSKKNGDAPEDVKRSEMSKDKVTDDADKTKSTESQKNVRNATDSRVRDASDGRDSKDRTKKYDDTKERHGYSRRKSDDHKIQLSPEEQKTRHRSTHRHKHID